MDETDGLRALLERIIAGEGGTYAADTATGLPRGTFSRWTNNPDMRPGDKNLKKLAATVGARYSFTERDILELAGYLTPEPAPKPPDDALLTSALRFKMRDAKSRLSDEDYDMIMSVLEQQVGMLAEAQRRGQLRLPKRQINYDGDDEMSRDPGT